MDSRTSFVPLLLFIICLDHCNGQVNELPPFNYNLTTDLIILTNHINAQIANLSNCIHNASLNRVGFCANCHQQYTLLVHNEQRIQNALKIPLISTLYAYDVPLAEAFKLLFRQIENVNRFWFESKCSDCFDPVSDRLNARTTKFLSQIKALNECVINCTQKINAYSNAAASSITLQVDLFDVTSSFISCNSLHAELCRLFTARSANHICKDVRTQYRLVERKWRESSCFQDMCANRWSFEIFFLSLGLCLIGMVLLMFAIRCIKRRLQQHR